MGPGHPGRQGLTRTASDATIIVVGAGAAGLATAIFARRASPSTGVLVLDGASRPGAKILVSGGSRCNVTNRVVTERDFNGGKPAVIRRILKAFSPERTVELFEAAGVGLHEEAHGKLFPNSNRSRDVLDALLRELDASGAQLTAGARVTGVRRDAGGFIVTSSRGEHRAQFVVLASGGLALPKSGSDGAGLEMARALGHSIVPTTPALVPLLLAGGGSALHQEIPGVALDVELSLIVSGAVRRRITGSLLWTHFGISGPAALDMSRHWLRSQLNGEAPRIHLNFCPGAGFDDVEGRWTRLAADRPRLSVLTALAQMLPASAAAALMARLPLDGSIALSHLTRENRRALTHALTAWPLEVTGSRGYTYAEVTAGGVSLDEIDPGSMQSRRCPGLFLVGEILDVDGRLGGFNFQWAWATGRVAGNGLARAASGSRPEGATAEGARPPR